MKQPFEKEPAILDLLERLRNMLGEDAFVIADHWEPDLCAIGIASPADQRLLAHISTYREPSNRYSYELELPPQDPEDQYDVAGCGEGVSFEELVRVVADHLNVASHG